MTDRQKRALGAFVAGFTLCFVMVRMFVTNDMNFGTLAASVLIPLGIRRALCNDEF